MPSDGAPENVLLHREVQQLLDRHFDGKVPRILEAGCGSGSHVRLPADRWLVGIDVEQRQLDANVTLNEKILGDLQTYDHGVAAYDLVLCWDVLEHLDAPKAAVDKMTRALAPNGLLVVAVPNLMSVKGLVTKLTPLKLHLLFYRWLTRSNSRDLHQFPTMLRTDMRPSALRRQLHDKGFDVLIDRPYVGPVQQVLVERHRVIGLGFRAVSLVSRLVTGRKFDLAHSDYLVIARQTS
jgi:SAM-dependent methyltransferase